MKLDNLLRYLVSEVTPQSRAEKFRGAAAAFIAVLLVGLVSAQFLHGAGLPLLVASVGASAVLLFAVPHSPLAQPWPLLGGHLISAVIGVTCGLFVQNVLLAAALAAALSIFLMHLSHSLHPPGAATALAAVLGGAQVHALGYTFVFAPVMLNMLLLLVLTLLFNNLLPGRRYPAGIRPPRDELHKHDDPRPLDRLGISEADLQEALAGMDAFLDVSREDLGQIYNSAAMHAYRRKMGEIVCADIMSRDLVSVEFGTSLEEAWRLLRQHKIKAIPVVDRARRVIGMIALVDFLKRANLETHEGFEQKLLNFIRATLGTHSDKPEVVGQIMASPAFTVRENTHIVELVPLLSDRGLHHIPIVNPEGRLAGMVTQSDLIAALYRGSLGEP